MIPHADLAFPSFFAVRATKNVCEKIKLSCNRPTSVALSARAIKKI